MTLEGRLTLLEERVIALEEKTRLIDARIDEIAEAVAETVSNSIREAICDTLREASNK